MVKMASEQGSRCIGLDLPVRDRFDRRARISLHRALGVQLPRGLLLQLDVALLPLGNDLKPPGPVGLVQVPARGLPALSGVGLGRDLVHKGLLLDQERGLHDRAGVLVVPGRLANVRVGHDAQTPVSFALPRRVVLFVPCGIAAVQQQQKVSSNLRGMEREGKVQVSFSLSSFPTLFVFRLPQQTSQLFFGLVCCINQKY